ncbi:MAG: hypothetical protein JNK82_06545 [Myxococcaceae bacterium]|nr:hypothetical protein [Myxococcaceae bacterium]
MREVRLGLLLALTACGTEVPLGFHADGTCGDGGVAGLGLDPSFGSCGTAVIDVGGIDNVELGTQGLAIDAQGRVLLAGTGGTPADTDLTVVRLLASGERDVSFGNQGAGSLTVTPGDHGAAVLVQPDGRIVVAGRLTTIGNEPIALVGRLLDDGRPDTTFGTDGTAKGALALGVSGTCEGISRRADGVLLCSGTTYPTFPSNSDAAVLSFSAAGAQQGGIGIDWFMRGERGGAAVLAGDGKVVVPVTAGHPLRGEDFAVARLDTNGALDPTFTDASGLAGRVSADFEGEKDTLQAVFVQPDGVIWAMGRATMNGPTQTGVEAGAVVRWLPSGALDTSFGSGGRLLLLVRGWKTVWAVLPLEDGTFLLGGDAQTARGDLALALQVVDVKGEAAGPLQVVDLSPGDDSVRTLVSDAARGHVYVLGVTGGGTGDNDWVVQRLIPEAKRVGLGNTCAAAPAGPLLLVLLARTISTRVRSRSRTKPHEGLRGGAGAGERV